MKYRIVEEDRNTETITFTEDEDVLVMLRRARPGAVLADSGQVINWRYIRRLVPVPDETLPAGATSADTPASVFAAMGPDVPHTIGDSIRAYGWVNAALLGEG